MKAIVLGAALLLSCSAHAQVYKCEVGGKLVFSDKPCVYEDKPIDIKPALGNDPVTQRRLAQERRRAEREQNPEEEAQNALQLQRHADDFIDEMRARYAAKDALAAEQAAIAARQAAIEAEKAGVEIHKRCGVRRLQQVQIGMDIDFVRKCTHDGQAKAQRVNVTESRHGTRTQWVMSNGRYIYFENGVVTSIQH